MNHHHESSSWIIIMNHHRESSSWITIMNHHHESSSWLIIMNHHHESSSWITIMNHHHNSSSWIIIMNHHHESSSWIIISFQWILFRINSKAWKVLFCFKDSTYSTKGYTSISVREPLENLRSAVPPSQPTIQVNICYRTLMKHNI